MRGNGQRRRQRERGKVAKRGASQATILGAKNSSGMPEIVGMWYDPERNRYFKISPDNPAPSEKVSSLPKKRIPQHSLSVRHMLRHAEMGGSIIKNCHWPSYLLGACKTRKLWDISRSVTFGAEPLSRYVALEASNIITLTGFPDGRCRDILDLSARPVVTGLDWNESAKVLVGVAPDGAGSTYRDILFYCIFGNRDEGEIQNVISVLDTEDEISHDISINPSGTEIATTCAISTSVRTISPNYSTVLLPHPDRSAGLVVKQVSERETVIGTRCGNVYKFDLQVSQTRPVWTGSPSQRHSSVSDFRLGADGHTMFISRMRNKKQNLAAWDMRMSGEGDKPMFYFQDHTNSHKRLRMDLDEGWTSGMLLSGGDDFCVRAWDSKGGGNPLWVRRFPGELANSVRIVPWGSDQSKYRPGAWIFSSNSIYTMELGANFG